MFNLFSAKDMGIDLGTANTVSYTHLITDVRRFALH